MPLLETSFNLGLAGAVILIFVFLFTIVAGFTGPVAGMLMRVALLQALLGGGQGQGNPDGDGGGGRGAVGDTVLGIGIIAVMATVTILFPAELVAVGIVAFCAIAVGKQRL